MAKIYISSTYNDLKDFREEVYRALRKLRQDAVAMEDYTPSGERPLDRCLADVDDCDIYVGIFAWRYGYIPPGQEKSITELEFRRAVHQKKRPLLFLLKDDADWKMSSVDEKIERIKMFREEIKRDFEVAFFSNKDELASQVAIAVSNALPSQIHSFVTKPDTGNREIKDNTAILNALKPIIIVFLAILTLTILTMLMCVAVPSISRSVDLKLTLSGLGGISTFLICCLMFIINKLLQQSKGFQ